MNPISEQDQLPMNPILSQLWNIEKRFNQRKPNAVLSLNSNYDDMLFQQQEQQRIDKLITQLKVKDVFAFELSKELKKNYKFIDFKFSHLTIKDLQLSEKIYYLEKLKISDIFKQQNLTSFRSLRKLEISSIRLIDIFPDLEPSELKSLSLLSIFDQKLVYSSTQTDRFEDNSYKLFGTSDILMDSTVTTSSLYNNASITSTLNDDNVRRDHEENKIGLPRESIYLQIHRAYFVRTSLVKPECAYYYYRLVGLADVAKCYLDLYLMYFLSPYKKGILAEQISAGADIKNLYSSHFIFFVALIQHKNKISHEGDKEAIYHFFQNFGIKVMNRFGLQKKHIMDLIAYIACSNYEPLCMVNDEDMINEVLGTNQNKDLMSWSRMQLAKNRLLNREEKIQRLKQFEAKTKDIFRTRIQQSESDRSGELTVQVLADEAPIFPAAISLADFIEHSSQTASKFISEHFTRTLFHLIDTFSQQKSQAEAQFYPNLSPTNIMYNQKTLKYSLSHSPCILKAVGLQYLPLTIEIKAAMITSHRSFDKFMYHKEYRELIDTRSMPCCFSSKITPRDEQSSLVWRFLNCVYFFRNRVTYLESDRHVCHMREAAELVQEAEIKLKSGSLNVSTFLGEGFKRQKFQLSMSALRQVVECKRKSELFPVDIVFTRISRVGVLRDKVCSEIRSLIGKKDYYFQKMINAKKQVLIYLIRQAQIMHIYYTSMQVNAHRIGEDTFLQTIIIQDRKGKTDKDEGDRSKIDEETDQYETKSKIIDRIHNKFSNDYCKRHDQAGDFSRAIKNKIEQLGAGEQGIRKWFNELKVYFEQLSPKNESAELEQQDKLRQEKKEYCVRLADGITEAAKTLLSTCRRTLNELFMTEILNKEDKELHEMGITKPKEEFKEVKLKLILLINILFILNEANFLEIKTNIDLYLSVCKAANDPATNEVNDEIKKTSFPLLIKELKRLAGRPSHFCVPSELAVKEIPNTLQ